MAAPRRKNLLASRRRRRQDEGEEEESVLGEVEDDSLSEGSAVSNVDDEADFVGSESSGDEREPEAALNESVQAPAATASVGPTPDKSIPANGTLAPPLDAFPKVTDASAKSAGNTKDRPLQDSEQLQFDDLPPSTDVETTPTEAEPPKAPRNETMAQRVRREHQEYIRQRNADPAFVPNRGEFFYHDNRNSTSIGAGPRQNGRGRGRGYGPAVNAG
jgi:hypothetical protein